MKQLDAVAATFGRKRAYGYFFSLTASNAGNLHKTETAPCCFPIGYSGLARVDNWTFLVVHDTKSECSGPRLGTLLVRPGRTPSYTPIDLNWGAEPANDLEAACGVPGKADEFLVTESSYQNGKFGRIFHIVLTKQHEKWTVEIKGKIDLPKDTEDVEGLACVANKAGGLTLLVGERGGSKQNPTGKIRWGPVDLVAHRPFSAVGEKTLIVPPMSSGEKSVRGCADLYVDDARRLWSVATQDKSDDGPFRSVIYQAGTIDPDRAEPVQLLAQTSAAWTCDAIKVEGLGPSAIRKQPIQCRHRR